MRYMKYLALVAVLMLPLAYSQAQVAVGVGVGPGYIGAAPVCAYGYYGYYPYACAPYGYYGPRLVHGWCVYWRRPVVWLGTRLGLGWLGSWLLWSRGLGLRTAVITALAAMPVVAVSSAVADMHAVRLVAASTVRLAVGFMAERWPTAVAAFTVVGAGSTAAAVDRRWRTPVIVAETEFPDPAAKDARRWLAADAAGLFFSPRLVQRRRAASWLWTGGVQ